MIWRIRALFRWLWEYITLTPKKYDDVVRKLELLLWFSTGGMYSKTSYHLKDMYQMVADHIDKCCEEAVAEALAERNEEDERKKSCGGQH